MKNDLEKRKIEKEKNSVRTQRYESTWLAEIINHYYSYRNMQNINVHCRPLKTFQGRCLHTRFHNLLLNTEECNKNEMV